MESSPAFPRREAPDQEPRPGGRLKNSSPNVFTKDCSVIPFSFAQGQALRDGDRVWPAYPGLKRRAIVTRPHRTERRNPLKSMSSDVAGSVICDK